MTASGRMSTCSFHADDVTAFLKKSAVGRCVIFETDTQVDPAQTASCILKCTHNKTGTYYNYRD